MRLTDNFGRQQREQMTFIRPPLETVWPDVELDLDYRAYAHTTAMQRRHADQRE